MNATPDLRILFPTSFSDACFRSIRAIAQLAGSCRVDLTLAHVADGDLVSRTKARRELDSFFAEADHYNSCSRLLLEGDPFQEICKVAGNGEYDLVMMPASDRIGLPAPFRSSFRARLMKQCRTPLWTIGPTLDRLEFRRGINMVTCLMDFDDADQNHLKLAMALASRMGAGVRLIHILDEIHEGTLSKVTLSEAPLSPELAIKRTQSLLNKNTGWPPADVAVAVGRHELCDLLSTCEADVLFVGRDQALGGNPLLPKMKGWLRKLPCPAICVDGAAANFAGWSFQKLQHSPERRGVAARAELSMVH